MKHTFDLKVRFHEVDAAGVVFYPRFFDYFHMTFEDFFGAATGVPYPVWIRERGIGWPSVHIEADYFAPLEYGMEVTVSLWFEDPGRSSFVGRYQIHSREGEVLIAEASITVVTTLLAEMKSRPIPEEVRAALARYSGEG